MRQLVLRLLLAAVPAAVLTALLPGCDKIDTNRTVDPYTSFGEIVYRESCQRVAYTGQLAQKAAGQIQTVDVSGSLGHSVCVTGGAPPATAPLKLSAIVVERNPLIATVDITLPKDFLATLETFLEQLLPLSDDGTFETAIASMGQLMGTMAADPDFAPALSRLAIRNGYRPTKTVDGLLHTIVNYPDIDQFIEKTLGLIAKGGTAYGEWKQLLTAGSMALKKVQPVANPADPERTLKLALNLLQSTHPDLAQGTPQPLVARDYRGLAAVAVDSKGKVIAPFVDANGDGLADVDATGHFVDANGAPLAVASPFVQIGTTDTSPRDAQGRALTAANATSTLYQYLELDGTVFSGLAREGVTLMDPTKDTTLGLVWGAGALLGPRLPAKVMTYDDGSTMTYNGFDTSQAAVLDLMHGFIQIFGDPNADQTLQSVSTLMNKYESQTSRLVKAMLDTSDRGKAHPEAVIPTSSDLYDDLMPLINRILAIDGLPKDLLFALQDNRTKDFAPMIARLMQARNQVDFVRTSPAYPLIDGGHDIDAVDAVDRTMPDVDYNRSLMQRIAHLIHDSNGVQFCNKDGASPLGGLAGTFAKCQMFEIDDLALFYVLNMQTSASGSSGSAQSGASFCDHITTTNNLVLNQTTCRALISSLVPINGFGDFPSPASLNRALFLSSTDKPTFLQDTTDDSICTDGDKFIDVHNKSLFAWETTMPNPPSGNANATFYTAVAPLIDAFAKHDECIARDTTGTCTKTQNAAKIFVDILAMLHTHWTSPNGSYFGHTYQSSDPTKPRFSYPDNLVSYEPLLTEVLAQGDLMPSLLAAVPTLYTMTVDGTTATPAALPYIIGTAKYMFAFGGAPGIAYRNGATMTVRSDGTTPVPVITPYYLIADAYAHKRNALDALAMSAPMQAASWKSATSALVDQFLTVDPTTTGTTTTYQFRNRRFRAISLLVINFLRSRLAAHATAGDLNTWVHETLTQDLTDDLGGPTFAALADFTTKVEADTDARTKLYGLLQYLVNDANDLIFQTSLTTLADQAQMFLDDPDLVPVARVMGAAIDPQAGTVDAQVTLIKDAHDRDTAKALLTVLRNLYAPGSDGEYPASNLADILSQLNRATPGQTGDLTGDDYRSILTEVQGFLIDDQRGFTRFLNIVKDRGPH
jgi:hypothetical protein